jgi:sulfotransferase family protein
MTVSPNDVPSAQPAPEPEPGPAAADGPSPSPASLVRLPGEPEAVFIVGVSRSGTTLMRRILGRHSRIAIADENHFMGHLLPGQGVRHVVRKAGDLSEDANVSRLVDLLYSDAFRRGSRMRDVSPFWQALPEEVPRDELERRLLAADRSEPGVFLAILQAVAEHRGKAIPGEKTPAHIRFAAELLEWYPAAKVVHMVRDPRGIYVSELKRRRERPESIPYRWLVRVPILLRLFVLAETVWAWADSVRIYRSLRSTFPDRYRAVRFEDLVREPKDQLVPLCRFLCVKFESGMLRQKVVSKGAREGDAGFDAGAAERWRARIAPWEARAIGVLLGRRLEQLGYSRSWRS